MDASNRPYDCCLCAGHFRGYGNNPWPLKSKGRCCDACNTLVVCARFQQFFAEKATANKKATKPARK